MLCWFTNASLPVFSLTHFCWKDRTSGTVEDDLIVFPDDCEFSKVEQCKDGRVFLLKFKSSNRKLFFWLQEPTNEKDDEYCRRVNELLNNPPSSGGSGGSGGGNGSNREGSELQYMLNNMSQQQLMQLFGGVGQMGGLSSLLGSINRTGSGRNSSSTPARTGAAAGGTALATPTNTNQPATPRAPKKESNSGESTEAATPASGGGSSDSRVLLSELQNYLAGINTGGGAGGSRHNVDLSTSLNSDSINSILSDPERLEALQTHLPNIDEEGKASDPNAVKQQLKDTLASPQFQQALSMFSNALQSGQLGPVVSQFKLSDDAVLAANSGDLEQFVKALEKASLNEPSAEKDGEDKKDDSKE